MARSEIDILFSPKALQNFEFIGQGDLKENLNNANLLIKGNNLLALHSLKKKFANKVKLIYIDPPYNTGNDSFNYNDNFNHSTWLTFMKNRLEIAKEFLRDDGVIFIQCDDNEQAYLKVLCDEIFGRDNFVGCIVVKMNESKGLKNSHIDKRLPKNKEYILIYGKFANNIALNSITIKKDEMTIKKYSKYYNKYIPNIHESYEKWKIENFDSNLDKMKFADRLIYLVKPDNEIKIDILPNCFGQIINTKGKVNYYYNDNGKILKALFFSENLTYFLGDLWLNISTININKESGVETLANAQKPEALLKQILELTTQENDLVMDFFAGSGTTLAVAHKMKRRWIGIEQMDYIESITKERLKKVVAGEQGGISKAANWQGGGSFIYAELMPLNVMYKEKIQNLACHTAPCHTKPCEVSKNVESTKDLHKDISLSLNMTSIEKELEKIYNDLESKAFVDYRVDIQAMLKDKEFYALSLDEKRKVLYAILDSNMDYVLYDDIDDSEYGVSDELRELNKIFYGENDE
ncbi:site-specific DNA-methyltransferase [Helicobacter cinaedi]|uniref:site-specific DNA-methyltransferase n=1 Tax=Helicobacter cinaedi TaxID=213 RepID=UPI00358DA931